MITPICGKVFINHNGEVRAFNNLITTAGYDLIPKKLNQETQGGPGLVGEQDIKLGDSNQAPALTDTDLIGTETILAVEFTASTVNTNIGLGIFTPTFGLFPQALRSCTVCQRTWSTKLVATGTKLFQEGVLFDTNAQLALSRVVFPTFTVFEGDSFDMYWVWFWDFDPDLIFDTTDPSLSFTDYIKIRVVSLHP